MKQYRAQAVLATAGALSCLVLTLIARDIALSLPDSMAASAEWTAEWFATQDRLRARFSILTLVSTVSGFAIGWILGKRLSDPLEALRSELISGGVKAPSSHAEAMSWNADANALRNAAVRFESELLRRNHRLERESADRSELLNAVSEGLIQVDAAGRIVQVNPAATKLLGLPDHVGGKVLTELVRNVDLRQVFGTAASGRTLDAVEVAVDERRLLVSAAPIPATGHAAPTAVISIADLTQLRRLEGVRRDFVANVSHELKTPLTSIHGYAETLRSDDDMPIEMRHQFLDIIHRNAVRLQSIVDDLLDLSRIESGVWHPDMSRVDAMSVMRDAWASCQENAAAHRVRLDALAEPAYVMADPDALRQVFVNLFENAVRYTAEEGRIAVRVAIDSNDNGSDVSPRAHIEIADSGIGIPRDALPRVFERFYRVDPARSRAAGGTGLGLAIVKHLMESMGGDVAADSELGRGTTITLSLTAA